MRRALLAGAGVFLALAVVTVLMRLPGTAGGSPAVIGGPFSLVDGAGKVVTDKDFRGKYLLVYFGYTHCPDVCPTTLGAIAEAISKLSAADQAKLVPLFITVDPQRDTPAVVGDYAHAFGKAFVGLTGSDAAIASVEQEYRVYAARHALKGGDYAMDHSSVIYVMGQDGGFLTVLDDQMAPAAMTERLAKLGA
jgi:protein SCO1/2